MNNVRAVIRPVLMVIILVIFETERAVGCLDRIVLVRTVARRNHLIRA